MPFLTRWWWTAEVASRLGMGACSALTPRSLSTTTAEPPRTALSALSHRESRASSSPFSPADTGKSVLKVVEADGLELMFRIFSSSPAVRMG
jgi:hypothetical protein